MATVLIVAPVFALIGAGYAAVLFRFVSETAADRAILKRNAGIDPPKCRVGAECG